MWKEEVFFPTEIYILLNKEHCTVYSQQILLFQQTLSAFCLMEFLHITNLPNVFEIFLFISRLYILKNYSAFGVLH